MNDLTLRIEVDYMSMILTRQAHEAENIEEYQSIRITDFAYDEQTREFMFLCQIVEETIQ